MLEDRRTFHPDVNNRPIAWTRNAHRLVVRDKTYSKVRRPLPYQSGTKATVAFTDPKRVVVCVRRNQRKEVLHALKKTGRVGQKRPRRNELSNISCK